MSEPIILIEIGRGLDIIGTPPPVQLNVAYSFSFSAMGGVPPYTWDLTGTLLTGLAWTASTATIAGTVTDPGSAPITVEVIDAQRQRISASFMLQAKPRPLSITGLLVGGRIGDTVSGSYSGAGGIPPYSFAVIGGALPAGVTLNPDGTPSGSFTTADDFAWQVRIRDSQNPPAEAVISDSATVLWPVLTLTGTYADATSGQPYSEVIDITGGDGNYSLTNGDGVMSGSLPSGLSLSIVQVGSDWKLRLSGTSTDNGSHSFTVGVDSSDGQTYSSVQSVEVFILWTPELLSPAVLLDDISPITDSGGTCSEWQDRSGNGMHATQSSAARQPAVHANGLNGMRTIGFDGVSDGLSLPSGSKTIFSAVSGGWVFILAKKRTVDSTNNDRMLFVSKTSDTKARFDVHNGSAFGANKVVLGGRRLDSDSYSWIVGPDVGTNWQMLCACIDWSTGAASLYENGTLVASDASMVSSGLSDSSWSAEVMTVGWYKTSDLRSADSDLACVVVGSGQLSPSNRQKIEGYYAHHFGIASSLPVSHPYKMSPPRV